MSEIEKDAEALLVRLCTAEGWKVRKVSFLGVRGAPDRLILGPGWAVWVELKRAEGGTISPHQKAAADALRRAGQVCAFVAGTDEVRNFVAALKSQN